MREKLLHLMKNEGLTSSRLAEILEIQPSGISHILSGRNKPGFDLLQKILRRFPRINPDWLLLDSETMYRVDADVTAVTGNTTNSASDNNLFSTGERQNNIPQSALPTQDFQTMQSSTHTNPATSVDSILNNNAKIHRAGVVRVVVFYDDQTFESFTARQ